MGGGWCTEILASALVLLLLYLRIEDLEIVLYMFFRLDIDPILTMIRPGPGPELDNISRKKRPLRCWNKSCDQCTMGKLADTCRLS